MATNRGVIRWVADGSYRTWLTPSRFGPKEHNPYTDVFALDYQRSNSGSSSGGGGSSSSSGGDVLFFGGRPGKLYVADYREKPHRWGVVTTKVAPSPITHVKSVNEYQVLVAGLRDRLALFDLRFLGGRSSYHFNKSSSSFVRNNNNSSSSGGGGGGGALPLLTFPQYRNRAHVDIGLDVDLLSGIVAAAHDDGTVALYSLRNGNRLRSPDIDRIRSSRGPIQAVQFQTFPRDSNPSLFVGVQSNINVYSFGAGIGEEDD